MEPFGTVTNFYPFLSEGSRKIVESILKEAEGHDDFVSRMVDHVLTQNETNDLTFFTTIQAMMTNNDVIFDRLRPRLNDDDVLRFWTFFHLDWKDYPKGQSPDELIMEYWNQAYDAVSEAWILFYMLILGDVFLSLQRFNLIDEAENLIQKYPELRCFLPRIHRRRGNRLRREGDTNSAMAIFAEARKLAEEYDDLLEMAEITFRIGGCLKDTNILEGIDTLEDAYNRYKSIGSMGSAASAAGNMGLAYSLVGEYDLAVEFYLESVNISEPNWWDKMAIAIVLARLFCDLDLPEEALEWIKWRRDGEEITPQVLKELLSTERRLFCLAVARTLIQLGQLEGVSELLDEVHKEILQSGDESSLLEYNFVFGLLELVLGNHEEGVQSIAVALEDAIRLKFHAFVNSHLIALVKTEVRILGKGNTQSSGPWMTRLEQHVREYEYPGIMMQHALLKAEYQEMIGETEAAQLTLQDALTFTDSPGVKTLRKRIQDRLQELDTSVDA